MIRRNDARAGATFVELKSQAEAIRIYTTQKQLGKDAELAAAEIVRRAERSIGVAIRRGQEEGTIAQRGDNRFTLGSVGDETYKRPISSIDTGGTPLNTSGAGPGIYDLTDNVTDEQFEEALDEAKEEGNLSRGLLDRHSSDSALTCLFGRDVNRLSMPSPSERRAGGRTPAPEWPGRT